MRIVAAAGFMALVMSARAHAQDASFLAGYWITCAGGREVSETWSDARGKVLIGTTVTLERGAVSWEYNRIVQSGAGLSFFATPAGQRTTEFPLNPAKSGPNRLVFENLSHDFPQRVIYVLDGKRLKARIEGTIGGKAEAMDWNYDGATLNQRCPAGT
jgi:hypothetical protein